MTGPLCLDTNILVRIATAQPASLAAQSARLLQSQPCHVTVLALAESGDVLQKVYGVPLTAVVHFARSLLSTPGIEFADAARMAQAIDAVDAGMDWFDAMLWAGVPAGSTVATFDRRFARLAAKLKLEPRVQLKLPAAKKAQ